MTTLAASPADPLPVPGRVPLTRMVDVVAWKIICWDGDALNARSFSWCSSVQILWPD